MTSLSPISRSNDFHVRILTFTKVAQKYFYTINFNCDTLVKCRNDYSNFIYEVKDKRKIYDISDKNLLKL